MPTVVARVSSPVRVVSTPVSYSYSAYPYSSPYYNYYRYGYYPYASYPYAYPYSYSYAYPYSYPAPVYSTPVYSTPVVVTQPAASTIVVAPPATASTSTTYGTCKATTGVGVTSNNCASGKIAVSTSGNGCMCADATSGLAGCGNVLNGVCK